MTWSIRWKVMIGTLGVVTCGLSIAGVLTIQSLERQHLAQLGDVLGAKSIFVEYGFQSLVRANSPLLTSAQLQETAHDLATRASIRVTVIAEDGTVLAESTVRETDLSALENHKSRPEIAQAFSTGQGQDIRSSHTTGERTMYRAILLRTKPNGIPVVVRVGLPIGTADRDISELKRRLFLALGVAFLAALALSIWLAHSITSPLSTIAAAAHQLSLGPQPSHIQTTAQDEVGLLASALNHLTDRLHSKIAELSEDRAQLLAVLTSMVEGVMVLDYRGHVLQINPALERMFGIARIEARGRPCTDLFRHQHLNELVTVILRSPSHHQDEIVLPLTGKCLQIEASQPGDNAKTRPVWYWSSTTLPNCGDWRRYEKTLWPTSHTSFGLRSHPSRDMSRP